MTDANTDSTKKVMNSKKSACLIQNSPFRITARSNSDTRSAEVTRDAGYGGFHVFFWSRNKASWTTRINVCDKAKIHRGHRDIHSSIFENNLTH